MHGIAFQANNPPPGIWTEEKIITTMQEGSDAILSGLKQKFGLFK